MDANTVLQPGLWEVMVASLRRLEASSSEQPCHQHFPIQVNTIFFCISIVMSFLLTE